MKVSRNWLQKYFDTELPSIEALAEALTFHAFEVEEAEGDMMDVNVLPDRAGYGLSHRGIATEVAAALSLPLKDDPFATPPAPLPQTDTLALSVCDPALAPRFMLARVEGVKVGPSPEWLRAALESVGQRSINNIVDATNYVMLDIGQPLHAFDAGAFVPKDGVLAVTVRKAYESEAFVTLTGESYVLPEGTLLIADGAADVPLGIAGVKGGKAAGVHEGTTDLVIEAANFDGTLIRRTSQALKLWTDASLRFQNRPSPELAAYGMRAALALITEVAGGTLAGGIDAYPDPAPTAHVATTVASVNATLGTVYSAKDMSEALTRLMLPHLMDGESFQVAAPFWRRDLELPEDLAEEAGRILGYEQIPATELPPAPAAPDQRRYRGLEAIKDVLLERGYVEISTPSFTAEGEILLANPLQTDRPYLRPALAGNMRDALTRAKHEAPRVLGPEPSLRLFELGTVFTKAGEHFSLALGYEPLTGKASPSALDEDIAALNDALPGAGFAPPSHDGTVAELTLAKVDLEGVGEHAALKHIELSPYRPYTTYPFALRDIAVWTPQGTEESEVALLIQKEAGELLARMDRFDRFEKGGRVSYAFRLVFEAPDRTLSDQDLDPVMERITALLNAQEGWEVR